MPSFPIVDTHLHLWNRGKLPYAWLRGNKLLDRPYLVKDYRQACGGIEVGAMVFMECLVDSGFFEPEVRFVEDQAKQDSRIKAIVAQASLENELGVTQFLEHLKATTPFLRGIRRIVEHEAQLDFCLKRGFIEGVKLLGSMGLSFDLTVNYRHMNAVLRFADLVGEVPWILDHSGKPAIREGRLEPWRGQIRALAAHPNIWCKVSGLATEADPRTWTEAQIRPYIDVVIEAFGFERVVFGSDWPVCLQAVSFAQWVGLVDRALVGVPIDAQKAFWRNNAIDFYRLDILPQ